MPLKTLNFVKNHAGLAEGWGEGRCPPSCSREKIPAINNLVSCPRTSSPGWLCFLVSQPSRFSVVTKLAPSQPRCFCALLPASPRPPACPRTPPAESMIRDLASDFRLWDKYVNVGSSVVWVLFFPFFCSFHLLPIPPGRSSGFSWDLPSFETLFSSTL